ncbi:MAG: hypothetical protein JWQ68_2059 [Cryobacterium sp.]|jgi:hypothetical protein|nr:hypothetical protein [Cryobacterium sp.]
MSLRPHSIGSPRWLAPRGTDKRSRDATREVGTSLGGVAVLCHTNAGVASVTRALLAAGLVVVPLTRYDGRTTAAVKVGTIKPADAKSSPLTPGTDHSLRG